MITRISLLICTLLHIPHYQAGNGVSNARNPKASAEAVDKSKRGTTRAVDNNKQEDGRVYHDRNSQPFLTAAVYQSAQQDPRDQSGYQSGRSRSRAAQKNAGRSHLEPRQLSTSGSSANTVSKKYKAKYDKRFAVDDSDKIAAGSTFKCSRGEISLHDALGEGVYGVVFSGTLTGLDGSRSEVAVKFQKPIRSRFQFPIGLPSHYAEIEHEYRMMKRMSGEKGFARVYAPNFSGKWKYFVTDLLGPDVFSFCEGYNFRVGLPKAIWLTRQMLLRIRALHQKGYVAQDIHLGNFVLSHEGVVHMIDLAFAFPYRQVDGTHIPDTPSHFPFRQGRRKVDMATRREEQGLETSRADDIERLLYMLLEMLGGELPWAIEHDDIKAKQIKDTLTNDPARLCKTRGVPWLSPLFVKVFKLSFDAEPPYSWIDGYLKDLLNIKEIASFKR